jgi:ferredoxin-type protein NapH
MLRRSIQIVATALSNGYWLFPSTRRIYGGGLKSICTPGLNCYSCPAATGACPLGSIQFFMAELRPGLSSGQAHLGLYVIGWLGLIGALVGRMPCAWLCPFGFFQELMHKIPSRKFEIPKALSYLKYLLLTLFIFILPLAVVDEFGYGATWFCKFVCPAGTAEAGLPMMLLRPELQSMIGLLFYNKMVILGVFLIWMILSRRPFCRVACPLGAIYSLFNRVSLFRLVHHPDRCVRCEACYQGCPMGVKFYQSPNDTNCIRCLKCLQESCRFDAISWEIAGKPQPRPLPAAAPGARSQE